MKTKTIPTEFWKSTMKSKGRLFGLLTKIRSLRITMYDDIMRKTEKILKNIEYCSFQNGTKKYETTNVTCYGHCLTFCACFRNIKDVLLYRSRTHH